MGGGEGRYTLAFGCMKERAIFILLLPPVQN